MKTKPEFAKTGHSATAAPAPVYNQQQRRRQAAAANMAAGSPEPEARPVSRNSASSEDEIESLKRSMVVNLTTLEKQRRAKANKPSPGIDYAAPKHTNATAPPTHRQAARGDSRIASQMAGGQRTQWQHDTSSSSGGMARRARMELIHQAMEQSPPVPQVPQYERQWQVENSTYPRPVPERAREQQKQQQQQQQQQTYFYTGSPHDLATVVHHPMTAVSNAAVAAVYPPLPDSPYHVTHAQWAAVSGPLPGSPPIATYQVFQAGYSDYSAPAVHYTMAPEAVYDRPLNPAGQYSLEPSERAETAASSDSFAPNPYHFERPAYPHYQQPQPQLQPLQQQQHVGSPARLAPMLYAGSHGSPIDHGHVEVSAVSQQPLYLPHIAYSGSAGSHMGQSHIHLSAGSQHQQQPMYQSPLVYTGSPTMEHARLDGSVTSQQPVQLAPIVEQPSNVPSGVNPKSDNAAAAATTDAVTLANNSEASMLANASDGDLFRAAANDTQATDLPPVPTDIQRPFRFPRTQEMQQQEKRQQQRDPQDEPSISANASVGSHGSARDPEEVPPSVVTTNGGIAIQELLNSPTEAEALHQFIEKENARHRQNSDALRPPLPPIPQMMAVAHHDSSPGSRSSYHSAGHSGWQPGRAETAYQDFATAHQSLSSMDGGLRAALGYSMEQHMAEIPEMPAVCAPLSTIPSSNDIPAVPVRETSQLGGTGMQERGHVKEFGFDYYKQRRILDSAVAQRGDDSSEASVNNDDKPKLVDGGAAYDRWNTPHITESPAQQGPQAVAETSLPAQQPAVGLGMSPGTMFDMARPGRKGTVESLENVLEYYRNRPHESIAEEDESGEQLKAPFPVLAPSNHLPLLSSSKYPMRNEPTSPAYHRTSFSSPVHKPETPPVVRVPELAKVIEKHTSRQLAVAAAAVVAVTATQAGSPPISSTENTAMVETTQEHQPTPMDKSPQAGVSLGESRQIVDIAALSAGRWATSAGTQHKDPYAMLEQLGDPDDDLLLPPAVASPMSPEQEPQFPSQPHMLPHQLPPNSVDSQVVDDYVQMESIGEFGIPFDSDVGEQLSDYGYASTTSSDSFGEPVAHSASMLGGSVIREHYEVDRLAEALANTHLLSQAVLGDSSDDEEEEAAAEAEAIRLIAGRLKDSQSRKLAGDRLLERGGDATSAEKKPSSVRTNTSTLTESSNSDIATVQHAGGAATAQTTNVNTVVGGDAGNVAAVATAAAAAAASAAAGSLPFEIMELTSELELLVGRDQEDYMSDPLSPSSVDLSVLQALGKAVHQQVLLHQQQQVNRRKSNFQINAPPPQLSQPVEQQQQQPEKQPLSLELDEMVQYDQQLQAMAKEVIEYCDESGLRQVFPLSTRWIDWLSRHPHRILPWRKYHDDADDDMENSDDDDNSDCSSESSFGLSPPAQAWPLPPTDILSKARIPMSTRRPLLARNVVPSQRQLPVGIEAHWQYYSVINQIVTVASGIHRQLQDERDHTFVVHQLAALYQFLGGEFSKFKKRIEKVFDAAKQMLDLQPAPLEGPRRKADGQLVAELPRLLDPDCAKVIGKMMQDIIVEALYSKWEIPGEPHTTNTPPTAAAEAVPATTATAATVTGGGGARSKSHGLGIEGSQYVVATLKGRPTRPIVRYLAREMKVVNTAERRRRGRERNMSRNPSLGHLRFQQAVQQQAMQHPLPPLPPQPPQANDKNMAAGHHRGDTPIKAGIDGAAATGGAAVTIVLSAVVSAPEEQHLA